MVEEAGMICAARHFNQVDDKTRGKRRAALARVEETNFMLPMFIGEIAQVKAKLTFVATHSAEVVVEVFAESFGAKKRLTNTATLWYVCVTIDAQKNEPIILEIPPLATLTHDEQQAGRERYEQQKRARAEREARLLESANKRSQKDIVLSASGELIRCPSPASLIQNVHVPTAELIQMISPSDCDQFGFVRGGVIMKVMDSCAGVCAFKHCRTNVVTASIEAIDFREPMRVGSILRVIAIATHASARSMEIEVVCDSETMTGRRYATSVAFFVFVSLDAQKQIVAMKPIQPVSEDEIVRFEEGRRRYEARRMKRSKTPSSSSQSTTSTSTSTLATTSSSATIN